MSMPAFFLFYRGKPTGTRRFSAYFQARIIFMRGKFGLAKRLSGFAVCGGSLLNGNRYRDCKSRKRTRNKNEREREKAREIEREGGRKLKERKNRKEKRPGENTNAAFSRQARGISALCKRNLTFLCKDRRGSAIFRA